MKKRVMILCDSYLPGYASGGAMHMVLNIVDRFCDRYDFFVVTRNYDCKSNKAIYTTVRTNDWNDVGNAKVFYFSKGNLNGRFFAKLANEIQPDVFLLNSAFGTPTVVLLHARRKGLIGDIPVIVAPCGSLAKAALALKALKKKLFLKYASLIDLYDGVIWKASFDSEMKEIKDAIGAGARVMVAPDLTPKSILPDFDLSWKPAKHAGSVKFVYFSRLDRKKNILFFLERLKSVKEGLVTLTFVGALEDQSYWDECNRVIERLPANVKIEIAGALPHQKALRKVSESHFLVLPTLNENFGYVCIESLAAGCPNLTSDQTVWTDIEEKHAGWRISLEDIPAWDKKIQECLGMNGESFRSMSGASRKYADDWLSNRTLEIPTAELFKAALNEKAVTVNG